MAFICSVLAALALLALWGLEAIARGGTCGPSEGGGSCNPGLASWVLLAGAAVAVLSAVLTIALPRRDRRRRRRERRARLDV